MTNNGYPKYVSAAVTGLLMGVGIGILFAPQSGKRTRKDIEKWGRKTKDLAWDLQENLKENTTDFIEDLSERARMNMKKGKELAEAKKNQLIGAIKARGNGIIRPERKTV